MAERSGNRRRRWVVASGRRPRGRRARRGRLDRHRRSHAEPQRRSGAHRGDTAHLAGLRHQVAVTRFAEAVTKSKRDVVAGLDRLDDEPARRRPTGRWPTRTCTPTCKASASTRCRPAWAASRTRSARSRRRTMRRPPRTSRPSRAPCTQLAGGSQHRPGLPLRLPRPLRHPRRPDLLRLRHQLGGREHSDHRLRPTSRMDGGRQRPPESPRLGHARLHLGPAVAMIGASFLLYYAVDVARHGQGVHLRGHGQPAPGPFTDRRRRPWSARSRSAGRSTRRRSSTPTERPYLVWKSGGPGSSKPLVAATGPVRHVVRRRDQPDLAAGAGPALGGRRPSRPRTWSPTGGHYYLFFSGNDWNSANYAVGVATCTGPIGPVQRRRPVRSSPADRAWRGRVVSRSSPMRPATSGSRSTPGFPVRWGSPTAATSTSAGSRSRCVPSGADGGDSARASKIQLARSAAGRQRFRPPGDSRCVQGGAQRRELVRSGRASAARRLGRAASGRSATSPAP